MKKEMKSSCPEERLITKFTEYVGSFAVRESNWRRRLWIIEEQMSFLKDCPRRRPVILRFCLLGVKMYDAEGETLLMAHALRRIQYSTCRPEDSQFAFVSHNPHCPQAQLFCHLFVGSQASEAQVLNLLLCRSFQLQYLAQHPELRDPKILVNPEKEQRKSSGAAVVREPLDPGEVSPNVNALISFRRVPLSQEEEAVSPVYTDLPPRSEVTRSASLGNSSCSPTLVRKKAIRSKVLRSGAYRSPGSHMLLTSVLETCREQQDPQRWNLPELSEKIERLQEGVWFCWGMNWEAAMSLLQQDRLGAYLLRADPDSIGRWTLFTKTQCGLIPYRVCRGQKGTYRLDVAPPGGIWGSGSAGGASVRSRQ
ncbi:SH2 domain-containing protein 5 isoform X2 [Xenopus laevis]|uniref:SH2 domain-containing protein 5 isoform X2 n=1 Tax=Xenopus laevis TaxID=8355 RepID=A0A8J1L8L2_XENLA|nr:SH2 domain-containing protein 5 isoform X2 [Xenopus laevis]